MQRDDHHGDREDRDDPLDGDVVALVQVADELRADARPVERLLGEHGAAEQDCELQPGDGDDRDHRVAEGVIDDHPALADAARSRRLDVVALHRLQEVHPDQADQHAADRQAEHEGRERQMLHDVPERARVAGQQGVDEIEVGDLVEVELDDRTGPVGRRPAELRCAELEQEAEEEDGKRIDDDPVDAAADVPGAVPEPARHQPQRNADEQRDHEGRQGQLEGRAAVLDDDRCDRAIVGHRLAEVEGHDLAEVFAVLLDDRLVVAGLLLALLELLGGELGAQRRRDRVARRHPHQQEHDGEQDEDRRQRQRDPRQYVGAQASRAGRPVQLTSSCPFASPVRAASLTGPSRSART